MPRLANRTFSRTELILREALVLFEERGYDATTMNDIGEAAGVTGPALYKHFRSKQAILVAIAKEHWRRFLELSAEILDGSGSPSSILERLIDNNLRSIFEHYRFNTVVNNEWANLEDEERATMDHMETEYLNMWRAAIGPARRNQDERELSVVATLTVGFIHSTCLYLDQLRAQLPEQVLVPLLTRQIMGIATSEAGPVGGASPRGA
jgi:AcrR family transcriptional regulator